MRRSTCGVLVVCVACLIAPAASAQVLRVGSYSGIPGQYSSIQAAVDAAQPGDTILVGPGDYKTTGSSAAKREKFRSLSVKVARGRWRRYKAHGRHTRVRLDLGRGRSHNVWVRFVERITVRGHHEFVKFATIYRRC